jgi:hypothetical protein
MVEMTARVFPDVVEAVAVVAENFPTEWRTADNGGREYEQPEESLRRLAAHLRVKTMTPAERAEWWRNAVGRPNSAIRRASGD